MNGVFWGMCRVEPVRQGWSALNEMSRGDQRRPVNCVLMNEQKLSVGRIHLNGSLSFSLTD